MHYEEVKEAGMPKRSPSQQVPKEMQARFDEITQRTSAFSQTHLNDEYGQLCRELTATLCRKRPSPLVRGKASTWACGILHAAWHGQLSLRFFPDPPHCGKPDLGVFRSLVRSTTQAKSKQIRDVLGMYPMDPDWSIPSMVDKNPLIWMRCQSMGSSSMCARHKGEIQEVAFRKGLIPYIPDA
jgi:uncharacterized protein DUF6398